MPELDSTSFDVFAGIWFRLHTTFFRDCDHGRTGLPEVLETHFYRCRNWILLTPLHLGFLLGIMFSSLQLAALSCSDRESCYRRTMFAITRHVRWLSANASRPIKIRNEKSPTIYQRIRRASAKFWPSDGIRGSYSAGQAPRSRLSSSSAKRSRSPHLAGGHYLSLPANSEIPPTVRERQKWWRREESDYTCLVTASRLFEKGKTWTIS